MATCTTFVLCDKIEEAYEPQKTVSLSLIKRDCVIAAERNDVPKVQIQITQHKNKLNVTTKKLKETFCKNKK